MKTLVLASLLALGLAVPALAQNANTAVAAATDFMAAKLPKIRAAAERGSASAQNLLGTIYVEGHIVGEDGAQAAASFGTTAKPDNAQSNHDEALAQSQGIAQNDPQAAVTRLRETAGQAIGKLKEMFSIKVWHSLLWVILIGVLARWTWRYFRGEDRQVVDMTQASIAREAVRASLPGGVPSSGVPAWNRPLLNASSAVKNMPGDGSAAMAPGEIGRRDWVAVFKATLHPVYAGWRAWVWDRMRGAKREGYPAVSRAFAYRSSLPKTRRRQPRQTG
ncbi:MAG: hypothetical protein LBE78_00195 [Burkholderiaceae bacterium]|jgi:hypothetical protein|nr:hypothetical protein [Burkholderiaceae bacterium]